MISDNRPRTIEDEHLDMAAGGADLDNGRLVCNVGVAIGKPSKSAVLMFDEADALRAKDRKVVFEPNDEG